MSTSRFTALPTTRPGWWALALVIAAPLLLLVPNMIFGPGPDHPPSVIGSLLGFLAVPVAAGLTAFAVRRRGERSLVIIIASSLLLLFVGVFFIGEVFLEGSA